MGDETRPDLSDEADEMVWSNRSIDGKRLTWRESHDYERVRANKAETREVERLRTMLRWALTTDEFGRFDGENVPDHWCDFTHRPDLGACSLHEQWVDAADACGLLDEMAALEILRHRAAPPGTAVSEPKGVDFVPGRVLTWSP